MRKYWMLSRLLRQALIEGNIDPLISMSNITELVIDSIDELEEIEDGYKAHIISTPIHIGLTFPTDKSDLVLDLLSHKTIDLLTYETEKTLISALYTPNILIGGIIEGVPMMIYKVVKKKITLCHGQYACYLDY